MAITTTDANVTSPPATLVGGALLNAPILIRAFGVALILGSILTAINQPKALFGASPVELLPFALVYITPFVVVTLSQILVFARRCATADRCPTARAFWPPCSPTPFR